MHSLLPLKQEANLGLCLTLAKALSTENHPVDTKNSHIQSKAQANLSLFLKEVA